MTRPEDIPEDVWRSAEAKVIDYFNWLGEHASDSARYVLTQTIARAIMAERNRCAAKAYTFPHYMAGFDEKGEMIPGSPYDCGRFDARKDILEA